MAHATITNSPKVRQLSTPSVRHCCSSEFPIKLDARNASRTVKAKSNRKKPNQHTNGKRHNIIFDDIFFRLDVHIWLRRNFPAGQFRNTIREHSQQIQPEKKKNEFERQKQVRSWLEFVMWLNAAATVVGRRKSICWSFGSPDGRTAGMTSWMTAQQPQWNSSTSAPIAAYFWRMPYARICMHFYGYWNWIFEWLHHNFEPHHKPINNWMTFFP